MQNQQQRLDLEPWEEEPQDTHIVTMDVVWTSDDPDPVAISRLKKAEMAPGMLEEQVLDYGPLYSSGLGSAGCGLAFTSENSVQMLTATLDAGCLKSRSSYT